jgi:hypothetical protein
MPSTSSLNDGALLRPEPASRETESSGGAVFIGLIFAGLAVFLTTARDLPQIATADAVCPVSAITYCDRQ